MVEATNSVVLAEATNAMVLEETGFWLLSLSYALMLSLADLLL